MWLAISRAYARLYNFYGKITGRNLRGLGWCLRHIKAPVIVRANNHWVYVSPDIAWSYVVLIAGYPNEPGTQAFLRRLSGKLGRPWRFVDVGASVGEMILDVAELPQATEVLAFEPSSEAAQAARISILVNKYQGMEVVEKALGPAIGKTTIPDDYQPNGSSLIDVEMSTLDAEVAPATIPTVILMDTEGSEVGVMQGGVELISRERPLIIFEYNKVSRKHFSLRDVRDVLPGEYSILRLRSGDGYLDEKLTGTWNCVAVHEESVFEQPCRELMVGRKNE